MLFQHNKINQMIHMIFVPTIVWSAAVLLSNSPIYFKTSVPLIDDNFPGNAAFILLLFYTPYYMILEPIAGV